MTLKIVTTSPMTTVQDAGRRNLRRFGVSTAGAMDAPSLQLANALCGNAPDAAALEFAAFGGRFTVDRPSRFAVTGGACEIRVDERPVAANESHRLRPGETLSIGPLADAVWGYLALSGGVAVEPVLGSRATHLRTGVGGLDGRALKAGDRLPLGQDDAPDVCLRPAAQVSARQISARQSSEPIEIRAVLGPQQDRFDPEILARFSEAPFVVGPQRDRMAMVLSGPGLPAARGHDIVSDGTLPGSIQVPGSGQPMVLMAESQTTGGYPKIATVIGADLPRLAQAPTGAALLFRAIARDEAEEIAIRSARALRETLASLQKKPEGRLSSEYLLSCDLIGGVYRPEEVAPDQATSFADGGERRVR